MLQATTFASLLRIAVGAKTMTDTKTDPERSLGGPHIAGEGDYVTLGSIADDKIGATQEAILLEVDAALERIASGIAAEKKALEALIERISRKAK